MKKAIIYGLICISAIAVASLNNTFEYKGVVTVRANEQEKQEKLEKKEEVKVQEIKGEAFESEIKVPHGQTFMLDIKNSGILVKTHDKDSVIIRNTVADNYVVTDQVKEGIKLSVNNQIPVNFELPVVEIIIPSDVDFDLDIKSNGSMIDVYADNLMNLKTDSTTNRVKINAATAKNIYVLGGMADIDLNIEEIKGNITGNTGMGTINLKIGNIDDININGFRVLKDETVKIIQDDENKFDTHIQGDLGKVIFK